MDTKTEFNTVKSIVEKLLEEDERCRNDDKWLTYRVFRQFTNIFIPFEDFNRLPAFETVKRTRAQIQNVEKRFPPTDPTIIAKRSERENDVSEWTTRKSAKVRSPKFTPEFCNCGESLRLGETQCRFCVAKAKLKNQEV